MPVLCPAGADIRIDHQNDGPGWLAGVDTRELISVFDVVPWFHPPHLQTVVIFAVLGMVLVTIGLGVVVVMMKSRGQEEEEPPTRFDVMTDIEDLRKD